MIEPYDRNNFLRQARPDTIVKKKKKKEKQVKSEEELMNLFISLEENPLLYAYKATGSRSWKIIFFKFNVILG